MRLDRSEEDMIIESPQTWFWLLFSFFDWGSSNSSFWASNHELLFFHLPRPHWRIRDLNFQVLFLFSPFIVSAIFSSTIKVDFIWLQIAVWWIALTVFCNHWETLPDLYSFPSSNCKSSANPIRSEVQFLSLPHQPQWRVYYFLLNFCQSAEQTLKARYWCSWII